MFYRTVAEAIETAGMDFDLTLVPLTERAEIAAYDMKGLYKNVDVWCPRANVGQHVVTNEMIKRADDDGYDKLLRLDDDVKFATKPS
jgi:hypothetical protein